LAETISQQPDDSNRIIRATDENNRSVAYAYDKKGQLTEVTDMAKNQWHYQYTGKGLLKRVTDPQGNIAGMFKYDNDGKVKQSAVRSLKHRYNYAKNRTTVTDENNNTTVFSYNEQGITTAVANAQGQTSEITRQK
jgi:YD repeat-containing protein